MASESTLQTQICQLQRHLEGRLEELRRMHLRADAIKQGISNDKINSSSTSTSNSMLKLSSGLQTSNLGTSDNSNNHLNQTSTSSSSSLLAYEQATDGCLRDLQDAVERLGILWGDNSISSGSMSSGLRGPSSGGSMGSSSIGSIGNTGESRLSDGSTASTSSSSGTTIQTSKRVKLQRWREITRDLTSQFKKLEEKGKEKREIEKRKEYESDRQKLVGLGGIGLVLGKSSVEQEEEALLRERSTLEQTHGTINTAIASAKDSRNALRQSTDMFKNLTSKMKNNLLGGKLAQIDSLIGKIGTRKRFENMVLLSTVGFCIAVIIFVKVLL